MEKFLNMTGFKHFYFLKNKKNILNFKKNFAFSLVELMISLVVIAVVIAAATPLITKKLATKDLTITAKATGVYSQDCEKFGDDCSFCTDDYCALCMKQCASNEYVYTKECICKSCLEIAAHCAGCNHKICKKCEGGYGFEQTAGTCTLCPAGTYSDVTT